MREWLDTKGNKVGASTQSTINSSTKDFTLQYTKLINHINNLWGNVRLIRHAMHELEIFFGQGTRGRRHLIIRYIPSEDCFEINITLCHSHDIIYAGEAGDWKQVLSILKILDIIKDKSLCEWKDANGNKINLVSSNSNASTTSVKNSTTNTTNNRIQFKNMINYHVQHKPVEVLRYEVKNLSNEGFYYQEICRGGTGTFQKDIAGVINETGDWVAAVYIDGKPYRTWAGEGTGIKDMLNKLKANSVFNFPAFGTPEHTRIFGESVDFASEALLYETLWTSKELAEWVDKDGKSVKTGSTTKAVSSAPDYSQQFYNIVKQIDRYYICTPKDVVALYDTYLELDFTYDQDIFHLVIDCLPQLKRFDILLEMIHPTARKIEEVSCGTWDAVLDTLRDLNIIQNKDLCK